MVAKGTMHEGDRCYPSVAKDPTAVTTTTGFAPAAGGAAAAPATPAPALPNRSARTATLSASASGIPKRSARNFFRSSSDSWETVPDGDTIGGRGVSGGDDDNKVPEPETTAPAVVLTLGVAAVAAAALVVDVTGAAAALVLVGEEAPPLALFLVGDDGGFSPVVILHGDAQAH